MNKLFTPKEVVIMYNDFCKAEVFVGTVAWCYNFLRVEIENRFDKPSRQTIYNAEKKKYVDEIEASNIPEETKRTLKYFAYNNQNQVPIMRAKDKIVKQFFKELKENGEEVEQYLITH